MYLLLGQRIGPEPTTDRFTAVMDGPDERIIPGNALAVSHDLPCKQTLIIYLHHRRPSIFLFLQLY